MSSNTEAPADEAQPEIANDDVDGDNVTNSGGPTVGSAHSKETGSTLENEGGEDETSQGNSREQGDASGDENREEVEDEVDGKPVSGPPTQFQAAVKGGAIKDFVSTLRAIVGEAKLTVTSEGISSRAVDPANVAMYDVQFHSSAFESFDASEGLLGVNLERFEEVLKLAKKGDLVQMTFDTSTSKLVIHIDGVEFTMACIDPDSIRQEPQLPEMDLPISFTIDEAQISRGVKAADMVSDHIRFRCDEATQTVYVEAEGDTDDVSLELTSDEIDSLVPAEGNALFSLDYVKDLSREFPKSGSIALTFGQDWPMMMEYELADGECDVLAMLAPRIQTD
ncbi:DNA polymerase sliding clamp [Halosimplex carlsbadense]|nr:DNA polymerase sliding clamp [Halosimplex carlsbadense]